MCEAFSFVEPGWKGHIWNMINQRALKRGQKAGSASEQTFSRDSAWAASAETVPVLQLSQQPLPAERVGVSLHCLRLLFACAWWCMTGTPPELVKRETALSGARDSAMQLFPLPSPAPERLLFTRTFKTIICRRKSVGNVECSWKPRKLLVHPTNIRVWDKIRLLNIFIPIIDLCGIDQFKY